MSFPPRFRILITAIGSHGDVLPLVALATEFVRRGHEVIVFANPFFAGLVAPSGAAFRALGTQDEYHALFASLPDDNPPAAMAAVARELARLTEPALQALRAELLPGATLAIGSSLFFAHRLLAETEQLPCATVHLAPPAIRSTQRPARVGPQPLPDGAPLWLKRGFWWLVDRSHTDRHFRAPLNALRARLGLPAVRDLFGPWMHQADALVALFPAWFADPPADWPAHLQCFDFPLDEPERAAPLAPELAEFLAAGPPPVGFSAGTATANAREFFAQSLQACERAGLRGLLLTHFAEQVPKSLPPQVLHLPYASYARLLPLLAAFVHHGGIGTTAQALRAAVPQLIRPSAYDQFDNARRVIELGVGRELLPKRYRAQTAATALQALCGDAALRERCHRVAARVQGQGVSAACEAILRAAALRRQT